MLDLRKLAAVTAETAMPQSSQTTEQSSPGKKLRWLLKALFCCLSIYLLLLILATDAAAQTNMGTVALGSSTASTAVTVPITVTGTVGSVAVVTQGAASSDFAVASGGSCAGGTFSSLPASCTVNVSFSPKFSGARLGAVVLYDSSNNVLGTTYLTGYGQGPQLTFTNFIEDYGLNTVVSNVTLQGVAVDGKGNLYTTDSQSGNLLKWVPGTQTDIEHIPFTTTILVPGCTGSSNTNCFGSAQGVVIDGVGNLYVTDAGNLATSGAASPAVYKLTLLSDGTFSAPVAITGPTGGWQQPAGIAVDGAGNVYVADNGVGQIYQLNPSGSGYSSPSDIIGGTSTGIAADSAGNVYVAGNDQVYKYTASESYGTARPVYWSASDNTVTGVAVDGNGNVFISDSVNRIAEATPVSGGVNATSYNTATPLAGDVGSSGTGVALDGAGDIYFVSDTYLNMLKTTGVWSGYSGQDSFGTVNPTQTQITNDGNQPLTLSGVDTSAAPDFQFVQTGTAVSNLCTSSTPLAPGASCNLEIDFDPLFSSLTTNPITLWENVTLTTNATPATATLAMQGTEVGITPTVTLTSSANPAQTGVSVTLTATLAGIIAQQAPTGTVAFSAGGNTITGCGAVAVSSGVASCTTSFASAGSQSITASLSADKYYNASTSNTLALSVVVPPDATAPSVTTFGTSAAPIAVGSSTTGLVTFTFHSAVTLHQIQALTQGATGQDFSVASGGSCAVNSSYGPSGTSTCTVKVTFTPKHPGIRNGAVVLSDASKIVQGTAYLEGYSSGVQAAYVPVSSTYQNVASGGSIWRSVAVDGAGDLFAVEDVSGGDSLFEMKPSVTNGTLSYSQTEVYSTGSVGTGTGDSIMGVAVDGAGNLFFIDNNLVNLLPRLADGTYPAYTAAVPIGSECGNGVTANCWVNPYGMAVDGAGNLYVADNDMNRSAAAIYKMTASDGSYSAPAALPAPSGGYSELVDVAVDGAGSVYAIGQNFPGVLYKSTWSGSAYSTPVAISVDGNINFSYDPEGIAADGLGNLYIADWDWGVIQLVPNGSGYSEATLANPSGSSQIAVDASGNVYLTNYSSLIVYSTSTPATLSFGTEAAGSTSSSQSVEVVSTGNAELDISAIQYPNDFVAPSDNSGACTSSSALTQGQSCYAVVEFAPTAASISESQPLAEDVTLTTNATPATATIPVTGTAVLPTPGETLAISANPIVTGTSATLTATMTGVTGGAKPTGTVTFTSGSTTLCPAVQLQSGVAICATTPNTAGTLTVQAAYSGDANYATSNASATASVVNSPDANPSTSVTSAGSQTVGSSGTAVVTINFAASLSAPVTLGAINVLTQGAPNLDFTLATSQAATGACAVGQQYAASASCTVTVTFTPKFSGPRVGAVVLTDNNSPANVVATAYLAGTGNGPQGTFLPGTPSAPLDGSDAFWRPEGVAVDGGGNLYVADEQNNTVYKMTLSGDVYSTPAVIAGNSLSFSYPESVAVDGAGNLYVANVGWNGGNPSVVLFTLQPNGTYIQTSLGTGWEYPSGVAVDGGGNVYVADNGSDSVVELTPSNGAYTQKTVVSGLSNPWRVAVDTSGNLYVANNGEDGSIGTVLKLTLAGSSYTQSDLGSGWSDPSGIAVDGNGNVYVADDGKGLVAKLTLQSDGSYTQTKLNTGDLDEQEGVALDGNGNLYVVDSDYTNVYKLDLADPVSLTFDDTALGWASTDSPQTVTYANIGNQPLTLSALSYSTDFPEVSPAASGACTASTQLTANGSCTLPIDFTPITTQSSYPQTLSEYVSLTSDAINVTGAQQIPLTGSVIAPAVQVALATSNNTMWVGGPAPTFTATITIPSTVTMPTPDGTITFYEQTTPICSNVALTAVAGSTTSWTATCTPAGGALTNNFTAGTDPVLAQYQGDTSYTNGISSNTVNEYVTATAPPTANFGDTSIGSANVGSTVSCIPLTIAFNASETLGGIQVLTEGSTKGDFSQGTSCAVPSATMKSALARPAGGTGSDAALCVLGTQYNQGDSCVVEVNFTPSFAGTRYGAVLLTDSNSPANVIGTGYLEGTGDGAQSIFAVPFAANFETEQAAVSGAAASEASPQGEDEPEMVGLLPANQGAIGSGWNTPYGVAVDGANNIYIADGDNQAVVKETYAKTNGVVSYTASTIGSGWSEPAGVAVDGAGNVYVADAGKSAVVKESLQPNGTFAASTIGSGWTTPTGVAVDGSGNVYVADAGNSDNNGFVSKETFIGGAYFSSAVDSNDFCAPSGVAVDGSGNVYVTDPCNGNVAKLTLAVDGSYSSSYVEGDWNYPLGIAVDINGNLYVADPGWGVVIRETLSNGNYTGETQIGNFDYPYELALTPAGNLVVADNGANEGGLGLSNGNGCCAVKSGGHTRAAAPTVRAVRTARAMDILNGGSTAISTTPAVYFLDFADPPQLGFATTVYLATSTDSPQTVVLDNFGNAQLSFSALAYPADFPEASGVATDCTATSHLAAGGACTLTIDFTPIAVITVNSNLLNESVSLTTNALSSTDAQTVPVSGTETLTPTVDAAMPTFSPVAGTYTLAQTVYLSDTTSGAVMYYTTDNSTPTTGSTLYTIAGIPVSSSMTIKAIAAAPGYLNSEVNSAQYVIGTITGGTDFTIVLTGAAKDTVQAGNPAAYNFELTPTNTDTPGSAATFPSAVNLTYSSVPALPSGWTVVFSQNSIAAASAATPVTMTIHTAQLAAAGRLAAGTLASRFAPLSLALLLLPFAGHLRKSAKGLSRLCLVLLLLGASAALAGLSGCSSGAGFSGKTPGTYIVTVTATMGTVSHISKVTLTVE